MRPWLAIYDFLIFWYKVAKDITKIIANLKAVQKGLDQAIKNSYDPFLYATSAGIALSKLGDMDLTLKSFTDECVEHFHNVAQGLADQDMINLKEQLKTALAALVEFVQAEGPFDCAYGFSQGAAMLTLLLQEDVQSLIPSVCSDLKFECVIICCSSNVCRLREALGLPATPSKQLDIPSLHVIGQKVRLFQLLCLLPRLGSV